MNAFKKYSLLLFFVLIIPAFSYAEEPKYQPAGPLNIRNQMPMYIYFMAPTPDKADTLKKGKFEVDGSYHVSNIIIDQHPVWPCQVFGKGIDLGDREWWVYIDTEVNRFDMNISYGILDRLEVNVDIPYFFFSNGYLDGFIENFEKTFSFIKTPNARDLGERYDYGYKIYSRANEIFLSTSRPNDFGEVSTYVKYKFFDETRWLPTSSLRSGIKFPTTKDELLGSKKFDYSIGILLDKSLLNRFFIYFNLNWVFIEKPDMLSNLDVFNEEMAQGILGFEYFLTDKTSMLFQATASTRIYDSGIAATGNKPVVLTVGFNHNFTDKISWQIAMDENTNLAAPDFGLFTGLKIRL